MPTARVLPACMREWLHRLHTWHAAAVCCCHCCGCCCAHLYAQGVPSAAPRAAPAAGAQQCCRRRCREGRQNVSGCVHACSCHQHCSQLLPLCTPLRGHCCVLLLRGTCSQPTTEQQQRLCRLRGCRCLHASQQPHQASSSPHPRAEAKRLRDGYELPVIPEHMRVLNLGVHNCCAAQQQH